MGRQSARILFQGKDHKDIYFQGHYHDKMYLTDSEGKAALVWEKIEESSYDVYGLIYTQGLYFVLAVLKTDGTSYYDRVFLLVGESLRSMNIVHRDKFRTDVYTYDVLDGRFYMGYTDQEVYIVWDSRAYADVFEISAQAAVKDGPAEYINSPMPKTQDSSESRYIYPSMGALNADGGVIKFRNVSDRRVYMQLVNVMVNTGISVLNDTGLALMDDGYIYFSRRTSLNSVDAEVTAVYESGAWTYDRADIPNVFARTNAESGSSVEEIYISGVNDMFRELMADMLAKIDKHAQESWNYNPTAVRLAYSTSAPIKTGAYTALVFMVISADTSRNINGISTGLMACHIDFAKNEVMVKHSVDSSSLSYVPSGMRNAARAGEDNYILWNTYRYNMVNLFRYDTMQNKLEKLEPEGVTADAPFIMSSYSDSEDIIFMNATGSNGNVNKLFRYNVRDRTTTVETIKIHVN